MRLFLPLRNSNFALYEPLCCFCSREEEKDLHLHYSSMMSWSQLHPCVLLLLPVVCSEAAQPAIGRLWSQPHNVPLVSEAWCCTPALRRQSAVTVHEEHRRQNRGLRSPTPSDLSLSTSDPPSPLDMDPAHPEDHNRWCNELKASLAAILFLQPLHLHLL